MREPIALGYLLARTSDTIADSGTLTLGQRLSQLDQLQQAIASPASDQNLEWLSPEQQGIKDAGELALLQNIHPILLWLHELDPSDHQLITQTLNHIIAGQRWDLEFFDPPGTQANHDQLLHYTYQVAGCVGEFWTEVGYLRLGDGFAAPEHRDAMLTTGKQLGQGLQLINIIRDQYQDLPNGRLYLPGDQAIEKKIDHWLQICHDWVSTAPQYLNHIRDRRVRFATALPFELALATANQLTLAGPKKILQKKVKIPRSQVRNIMAKTAINQLLGV